MRFDDSLETVLSADMSTPFGAQSTWRQLVDLIGRRRVPADPHAIAKLKAIRPLVPPPVRAASARMLGLADPPAALVRLFFDDEIAIAGPVLRIARLRPDEWIEMLPGMSPAARSVLRHRRDLPPEVCRALEAFGSSDYRLGDETAAEEVAAAAPPAAAPLPVAEQMPPPEPAVVAPRPVAPAPIAASPAYKTPIDWTQLIVEDEPVAVAAVPMDVAAQPEPPVAAPAPDADWPDADPVSIDSTQIAPADGDAPVVPEDAVPAAPEPADVPVDTMAAIDRAAMPAERATQDVPALAPPVEPAAPVDDRDIATETVPDEPGGRPADPPIVAPSPFVSVGAVALGLPVVAEALRRAGNDAAAAAAPIADADRPDPIAPAGHAEHADDPAAFAEAAPVEAEAPQPVAPDRPSPAAGLDTDVAAGTPAAPAALAVVDPPQGPFQIAELVARIDAYQRRRDDAPGVPLLRGDGEDQPALFDLEPAQAQAFRFETDAAGVVRWVEGAARAPLIGLSLGLDAAPAASRVDGIAAGAFRRRAGFADARLVVDGSSDAAGQWRITGLPVFDRESGRFSGYRGTARRPRADESAAPVRTPRTPATDALRQLVHELRTPTNAIAGFAEMIETQLLGPVPGAYRDQAATIRAQAAGLLDAIDDIDLAARIESHALELRADKVELRPLLVRVAADLGALAALRRTDVLIDPGAPDLAIAGDERAVERLIARLMSTIVASGSADERISVTAAAAGAQIVLAFDRPRALAAFGNDAILTIDAEAVAEAEGAPLLGTGFALRLARNLAAELGGTLSIDERRLTLRLPAAVIDAVEQASSS